MLQKAVDRNKIQSNNIWRVLFKLISEFIQIRTVFKIIVSALNINGREKWISNTLNLRLGILIWGHTDSLKSGSVVIF